MVKDEEKEMEIEIEDESFVNPLIANLLRDSDVEYAGNIKDHPLKDTIRLIVRTKNGSAREALDRAIRELRDELKELREELD